MNIQKKSLTFHVSGTGASPAMTLSQVLSSVGEHLHPILKLDPVISGRVTLMIGAALEARAGALRT